jgi:LPS-assembly protein
MLSPFFKLDYWNYAYKNDRSDRQIITKGTVGLRASCGIFEMGTAYEQRRVSGSSAFGNGWDRVSDADTFYQRVGIKISPSLRFSAQATIDLTKHKRELKTVDYILTYNNSCCTRWELTYHDDKLPGDKDNWFTLTFAITAFPDTAFKWGNHSVANPFGRPGKLKPRIMPGYVATMMESDGTLQAEKAEIRIPVFDL